MCTRRWLKKGNEDPDPSTLSRQSSVFVATNASCSHFLLCSRWRQFHRLSLFHSSHPLMEVHWGASTSIQNTAEWEQHEVSWVTHGPSGELGPTPSGWALQGMQNRRMAVRGHRAACNLLSWEKEEHIPLLPSWLPVGDKALVWSPTEKHCFTSSLHFQPLAQNMTKRELQFIKNQPLGLIILLELTFILLLGQNAST